MALTSRFIRGACGFALALLAVMAAAAAGPVKEYELKAALLYNFASFTIWPASAPAGMTVCVLGSDDPFGPALDALTQKDLRGAQVEVRRVGRARDIQGCHVVYLSETDAKDPVVLEALHGKPVLTVADGEEAVQRGVMIGLRLEGPRLVFDVNSARLQAAGLTVSSKLLRLARSVYPSP